MDRPLRRNYRETIMDKLVRDIIQVGRTIDPKEWEPGDVFFKLGEEMGELAEAVQVKRGKIHKELKEDEFGELADVLNCAIDLVSQVNRNMSPDEFMERLHAAMAKKTTKWKGILDAHNAKKAGTKTTKRIRKANTGRQKRPEYAEG